MCMLQVVRMLFMSLSHMRATRAARLAGIDPILKGAAATDGGDILGLGIRTQETDEERSLRTRVFMNGEKRYVF